MSNLRRYFKNADICFITNVTFQRKPILIENIDLLRQSIDNVKKKSTFNLIAWVILPDHFHFILDPKENDPTKILQRIKMSFGVLYRVKLNIRSGRIWQNRFWDHIIRNQNDLNLHVDYIHFNPVKHGYVTKASDWEHSSILDYINMGVYQKDWEIIKPQDLEGDFGE